MNSEERRNRIIERLEEAAAPISATALARDYLVTRQIIVADVALLRAAGYNILADNRGYVLDRIDERFVKRIVVKHDRDQVVDELYAIVDNGGKVLDVTVEHSIYGRISAELNTASRYDVDQFVKRIHSTGANPLSILTEGLHIHTIVVRDEDSFIRIKDMLDAQGILIETT